MQTRKRAACCTSLAVFIVANGELSKSMDRIIINWGLARFAMFGGHTASCTFIVWVCMMLSS